MRIHGLPEPTNGEDLVEKMKKILNPLLGREEVEQTRIERVHRIRRPQGIPTEVPRDIIVRFHYFEDKAQIWGRLKKMPPIKYGCATLQIFADLSHETLMRRWHLKPLLEQMLNKIFSKTGGFLHAW